MIDQTVSHYRVIEKLGDAFGITVDPGNAA
jgi:hypothetical protein